MLCVRLYLPARFPPIILPYSRHRPNLPGTTCQAIFASYLHALGFPENDANSHECMMIPDK